MWVLMDASKARRRYIRVLTRDDFIRQFIEGQKEYSEVEVVSNLQYAMDGLLADLDESSEYAEKKAEIIGDKVLMAEPTAEGGESMQLRFDAELKTKKLDAEGLKEYLQNIRIAVVDDDLVIRELIKLTFSKAGADVSTFSDGASFITSPDLDSFDLVFLDILMPNMDGFAVLNTMKVKTIQAPVIVLSAVTQRDMVIKAFQMGIKSYITKPLKPGDIFKKAMEILKPDV
jgi:CheY-like chemotaxis protein